MKSYRRSRIAIKQGVEYRREILSAFAYRNQAMASARQSSAMAWIRPDQVAGVSLGITGKGISSAMRQAQGRGVSA